MKNVPGKEKKRNTEFWSARQRIEKQTSQYRWMAIPVQGLSWRRKVCEKA
jgi:hypothetical protein